MFKFAFGEYSIEVIESDFCVFTQGEVLINIKKDQWQNTFLCNIVKKEEEILEDIQININYKEPAFACNKIFNRKKHKTSEREILISRIMDKILRVVLKEEQIHISCNITLLKSQFFFDYEMFAIMGTLFALKKLYNINVGYFNLPLGDDHSGREKLSLLTDGKKIFYLNLESNNISPKAIVDTIKNHQPQINILLEQIGLIKSQTNLRINKKVYENNIQDFSSCKREFISEYFCENNIRADKQRALEEIRTIKIDKILKEQGFVFSRGDTKVLAMMNVANDTPFNIGETIRDDHNLVVSYNFPGFCTGNLTDKKFSKREISHGDLIRAAFQNIVDKNFFLRLYAEVLSSNGSSSMASVSALGALLYDQGILSTGIAGISLGCFRKGKKQKFIVDITAEEDQFSEMDFKICATTKGITAIRADFKSYLNLSSLGTVLKLGYNKIQEINQYIEKTIIPTHKSYNIYNMGAFIGQGGKNIKSLSRFTGSQVKSINKKTILVSGGNEKLLTKSLKPFLEKSLKKNMEIIAFISEQKNTTLYSNIGKITIDKEIKITKDAILGLKTIDPEKLSFKLLRIHEI